MIDPKALTKDELYGTLDSTTLEYSDGIFTAVLRRILDNVRGEQQRDHWIVFDGDVDPQWVSTRTRTHTRTQSTSVVAMAHQSSELTHATHAVCVCVSDK